MKFLLDESADARLARYLRSLGHDVTAIAVDYPRSLADHDVLSIAYREGRILITNDRDFGELVIARRQPHAGVLYLRLGENVDLATQINRISFALVHHTHEIDQFLVVTRTRVRRRLS